MTKNKDKKPPALFDVDNVIADFTGLFIAAVNISGVRRLPHDWYAPTWDLSTALDLSDSERARVDSILCAPGMARNMAPLPGAVATVKSVAEFCDVYFVTSPIGDSPTWCYDRRMWLINQFGKVLGEKIVLTEHKSLVRGCCLVDDKVDHCRAWGAANPFGTAIRWMPRGAEPAAGLCNVNNLDVLLLEVAGAALRYVGPT